MMRTAPHAAAEAQSHMVFVGQDMSRGSEAVTRGVRVIVSPWHMGARSDPDNARYIFGYRVRIANEGAVPVQLIARRWLIVDADGQRNEVQGEGVIGQQPVIQPGDAHEYESFCPLETPWGTMEGEYLMRPQQGDDFFAKVDRFYLAAPPRDDQ